LRVKSSLRIDEFLPDYHFHEIHSTCIDAPASQTYQAVKMVTPSEIKHPEEFLTFSAPDHVKVAVNFLVEGNGRMSRVITETRIYALDKTARRKFALYWLLVRPGSALIRRDWLGAIRKRAEARM
jgi:hypothetical protein